MQTDEVNKRKGRFFLKR